MSGLSNIVSKLFDEGTKKMQEKLSSIEQKLDVQNQELQNLRAKIEEMSRRLEEMQSNVKSNIHGETSRHDITKNRHSESVATSQTNQSRRDTEISRLEKEVVYATFSSPDSSGVIKCPEYALEKTSMPHTYFIMELDRRSGQGIYRINTDAKAKILGDLQMIRDFVAKFAMDNNNPSSIEDVNEGIIVKEDDNWVVKKLLEIKLQ